MSPSGTSRGLEGGGKPQRQGTPCGVIPLVSCVAGGRSQGIFRPSGGPHGVVLRQGHHVRGAHPDPNKPKGSRAESHHARRHRPGQAYEEAHMRKRPALCPPMGEWQPWSQAQMRCSPGTLGACAAPMTCVRTPRIQRDLLIPRAGLFSEERGAGNPVVSGRESAPGPPGVVMVVAEGTGP